MSKRCPTPYKQGFYNRADAVAALYRQRPGYGRRATKVYQCSCGRWHMAGPRRPVSEEGRKRNHRRKGGASKWQTHRHRHRRYCRK